MDESDNVRLLRRLYEAVNSGDVEAAVALCAPEFELHHADAGPHAGRVDRGREAVRRYLQPEAFESQRAKPRAFVENDDVVLVEATAHARGAGSGVTLEMEIFQVWRIRAGLAASYAAYFDRDRAYEAAGLTP